MNPESLNTDRKKELLERAVALANRIPSYSFILSILLLFFLRFHLTVNEEHYMALAKQFFDPDWIANPFFLNEFASTRLFYQYLVGWPLQYFSFEVVVYIGKILLAALMAWPLSRMYRLLGLTNIDVLLHLPLLCFFNPGHIGDEFIFLTLEPKGFGYAFVFFALYDFLRDKYRRVAFFSIIATYFHLLVGGWFMLYFLLYHLISLRSIKQTVVLGLIYAAGVFPFLVYLFSNGAVDFSTEQSPVDLDWIFTYVKQPFHTAPFVSMSYFVKEQLEGTLFFLGLFLLCLFLFNRYRSEVNLKINRLNILMGAGTFFFLLVALVDRTGSLLKYFPFRINALFTFLVFLQAILFVRSFLLKENAAVYWQFGILVLFLFGPFPRFTYGLVLHDAYRFAQGKIVAPALAEAAAFIRENTDREDVVFVLSGGSDPDSYESFDHNHSLVRRMERERFFSFPMGPNTPGSMLVYEWYLRLLAQKEAIEDYRRLCEIRKDFRINYVLSDFKLENLSCGHLVYENETYSLYKIEQE